MGCLVREVGGLVLYPTWGRFSARCCRRPQPLTACTRCSSVPMFAACPWTIPNLLLHDEPLPVSGQRAFGYSNIFVYCSNPGLSSQPRPQCESPAGRDHVQSLAASRGLHGVRSSRRGRAYRLARALTLVAVEEAPAELVAGARQNNADYASAGRLRHAPRPPSKRRIAAATL